MAGEVSAEPAGAPCLTPNARSAIVQKRPRPLPGGPATDV